MRERGAGFYHGLAIAAVVIWGTTFVSTKVLLTEGLSPAAIMFLRFLIAYAVLRTVCPRNERPVRFKDELMFAAAGITGGSMYFLTENMALQITLVSNVALLLTTSPIMTVLLSRLFFRRTEPFGRPVVLGMLVALAGVALVVYNGNFILQIRPWGDGRVDVGVLQHRIEKNRPALYDVGNYPQSVFLRSGDFVAGVFFHAAATRCGTVAATRGVGKPAVPGAGRFVVLLRNLEHGRQTSRYGAYQ